MEYTILKKVRKGLIWIAIIYFLYAFVNVVVVAHRLELLGIFSTEDVKSYPLDVKVTDFLSVSENELSHRFISDKRGEFLESVWLIDNALSLTVINIGAYSENFEWNDMIKHRERKIPNRSRWFNFDVGTMVPHSRFSRYYVPLYNSRLLPMSKVNSIEMFVDGEKFPKILYGNSIMYIPVVAQEVSFSFNGMNRKDLSFTQVGGENPPLAVLIFYRKDRRLYVGRILQIKESERDIIEFLKFNTH